MTTVRYPRLEAWADRRECNEFVMRLAMRICYGWLWLRSRAAARAWRSYWQDGWPVVPAVPRATVHR